MSKNRKTAYLLLLTTAVIWGVSPPIIKYSFEFIPAFDFLVYRFIFTSLFFLIPLILTLKKNWLNFKQNFLNYLFLGFLGTPLSLAFLFYGLQSASAIDASLISITAPILIVLGGALFLKEEVTKKERLGLLIALFGTLLTLIQPLLEGQLQGSVKGNLLIFVGTLFWCLFTVLVKKNKQIDSFILVGTSYLTGTIIFLPLFFILNQPGANLNLVDLRAMPGILYMTVLGSCVAYLTYLWGLKKIEASEATIFTYLQPIFAVPAAVLFLKETITLPFTIGAFFIAVGVYLSEKK